ncbi:MAG TPA: DUF3662 and FHA domain-containing protein [Ktedonobacteraceae bacterium]|nr:DUF3662 and FHA domain-containing protein [Ktedonobacteraceae bacterium]
MKARQSPLARIEAFLQRIVEGMFSFIPSKLEPVELARKLERAMEDNTLQGVDRRLAPNVYDIYLSIKDHQRLAASQSGIIKEFQDNLVSVARHRHYTLKTVPVIRMHTDSSLRAGSVRIETEMSDRQSGDQGGDGAMATQAISAEQLAQMRNQMLADPQVGGSSPNFRSSNPNHPSAPLQPAAPAMPQAWLTIRLPQAGQQVYRIEKPVVNIGRQLSNDIIVEDKRVSRYHAQVKFQPNGQFSIFDLGSTNGITVNGTPNLRNHNLRNGDRFTIGNYDFYFERR